MLLHTHTHTHTHHACAQVTSDSLEVGSSVLLPPVLDRLDLLLSILPEDLALIATLSVGQVSTASLLDKIRFQKKVC